MKKIYLAIFISCIFPYDYSGYIETNIDALKSYNSYYLGYSKARLNINDSISNDIFINSSIVGINNFGKQIFTLMEVIPKTNNNSFDEIDPILINDRLFLDQLYVTYKKNNFKILLGKQPLYYGSGYIWNPVNNISFKNSIDPTYEIEGISSIRIQFYSSERDYDFVFLPNKEGENISFFSSMGFSFTGQSFRFYLSRFLNDYYNDNQLHSKFENAIGYSQSGALFNIGVWSELYNYINSKRSDWLIGFDYTFNNGIYMMYERYHQDLNYSYKNEYPDHIFMDLIYGNINSIGIDYSFSSIGIYMDDNIRLSIQGIFNHTDESRIIFPQIDCNYLDDVDIVFMLYLFNGKYNTEYGINDYGCKLRMNIYF